MTSIRSGPLPASPGPPRPFPRSAPALAAAALALLGLAGCQKDEITEYQAPRANATPVVRPAPRKAPVEAEAPKAAPGAKPLTYKAPAGWKERAPKFAMLTLASFVVQDGDNVAELTISKLGRKPGTMRENVNRWREQVGLEEKLSPAEFAKLSFPKVKVDTVESTLVDVSGPRGRMLLVLTPHLDSTYFFKMLGHKALVDKQKPAFDAFLKTVKFRELKEPPMSDTAAIQTAPSVPPGPANTAVTGAPAPPPPPPKPATRSGWYPVLRALKVIASLRLTVGLFVLSLILVFYGTMAQIDSGIWTIMRDYFRSFWVWIPLQLNVQFGQVFFGLPKTMKVPGWVPFPGGLTIGSLLLLNLLAAHAVRFKMTWKRSGIFLIHAGVIVLLLGELVTGQLAKEGRMRIWTGEASNYVEDYHTSEVAFISPHDNEKDNVVVVPGRLLRQGGTIQNEKLPCDIEVQQFMVNSALKAIPPDLTGKPRGWEAVADKRNVFAAFRVGEAPQSAEFTVNSMPRNFGDPLANYNRWLAQVGRPEIDQEAFAKIDNPAFRIDGQEGQYFDIAGDTNRILLVRAPRGDAMWFYKLMGPKDVVEAHKNTFEAFVRSVRYFDPNNPAGHGAGLSVLATPQPEVSGASSSGDVDMASSYLTFKKKGTEEVIGTYLMSVFLIAPQEVVIDGKPYQAALRFKRTYKPYTIRLEEFTHKVYPGTDKAKDFASQVEVTDNNTNEKQKVRISMNNPLHYAGETFYQSEVLGKDQGTVLQVVNNPGWQMPYISCVLVALGMLVHFGMNLFGFLRRRAAL